MFDNTSSKGNQEISAGLLRQRRNLIALSLIMPLFVLGSATVEQINLFGTIIHIKSQTHISITIFVIFAYFLWRYWQYYREEDRAQEFRSLRKQKHYNAEFKLFSDLMEPKMECFEYEHYYPCFKRTDTSNFTGNTLPNTKQDIKIKPFKKTRAMEVYGLDDKYAMHYLKSKGERYAMPEEEINAINKHWKIVKKKDHDPRSDSIFETSITYNTIHLKWIHFLESVKFIFSHPYFSDYDLPFYIAGASAITIIIAFLTGHPL